MSFRTLTALLLLPATLVFAAAAPPPALTAYRTELARVQASTAAVSLEPLLNAALAAQDAMMQLADGDQAWIETLDEAGYTQLQAELPGFHFSRGYDVYTQPDAAFLLSLAHRKGRPEDQAFFTIYAGLWSDEYLPRYLSLGTRPTPCVRFGENILPTLYTQWRDYAARYPQAYVSHTQQTLRDLEEAVALGVCACGDTASVERELSGFVKQFPQTPVAADIRKRLIELKETPDLRPIRCR